jgi:diguanylate cyclase (GGDEF)-like protein
MTVPYPPTADALAPAGSRHVSGAVIWYLVHLVRNRLGEEGVSRLLALAGESRDVAELEDDTSWSSFWQAKALFHAAAEVLGDPHATRAIGEDVARADLTSETAALLRSLGSPGEVLRHIAQVAPKFCTVVRMEPLEIGESDARIGATSVEGFPRFPLLCDFTAGLLAQVTIAFDMVPADVVEEDCEARGAPRCVFHVSWDTTEVAPDPQAAAAGLEAELAVLEARLGTLQDTVADLVSADEVAAVLARITARAGRAVRAPRYVLVVRARPESEMHILHEGFEDDDHAAAVASEVMVDDPDDRGGARLIVDVVSARQRYGRLAAIYDDGLTFFPTEQLQLSAYARLAAAALDAATAVEEARKQATTAGALFDLARSLANVTDSRSVCERLAASVPAMVDCDCAVVSLWDGVEGVMTPAGWHGLTPDGDAYLRSLQVRFGDTPLVEGLVALREPQFADREHADAFTADVLAALDMTSTAIVPIVANDQLLGIVSGAVADDPERLRADPEVVQRLTGLADLAATALENARLIEHIQHQALYDAITGLPNKRLLEERVEAAFIRLRDEEQGFTLFFLDLDRFKNVNDTLGHAVGDVLLKQVGERLTEIMQEEDTIARLGGDEFALLLPRVESSDVANVVADKLYASLQQPFLVGGQQLFITSSIGIAIAPRDGEHYETLLKHADIAMYRAKQQGRNRYATYSPSLHENLSHRLRLEGDLHRALANGQLHVWYQPQIDLATGGIVGVEALVRWHHPELGVLAPDEFVSLGEETGLIVEIDTWVLRQACRQARGWRENGLPELRIAVNLSTLDLLDPSFVETVAEALGESRLDPPRLQLEVTERVVGTGSDQLLEVMARLKRLGVSLAIDDFGTGSSGLSRLRSCPIDTLKIDKSFVHEVTVDRPEVPLLAAMVSLAHDLGLTVVAEGVESREQVTFLRNQRCDLAQGYWFGRPAAPAGIVSRLQAQ